MNNQLTAVDLQNKSITTDGGGEEVPVHVNCTDRRMTPVASPRDVVWPESASSSAAHSVSLWNNEQRAGNGSSGVEISACSSSTVLEGRIKEKVEKVVKYTPDVVFLMG